MIELLFPPQWIPTQPYLGLACLAAYLRQRGIAVHQTDVNALVYDRILSRPFLEECRETIERKFERLDRKSTAEKEYSDLVTLYIMADSLVESVEEAKENLKSERSLDLQEYLRNLKILQNGLRLVSTRYDPFFLSFSNLKLKYSHRSSRDILSAVSDPHNFFLQFYEDIVSHIVRKNPSVCGISITGVNQIIPGLTLAHCIKRAGPSIFTVLGGSIVTRWMGCLGLEKILDICDSIVFKEGEEAVAALATEPIEKVPSIGYKRNGRIIFNSTRSVSNLDGLPPPSFDDLDLGLYLSPSPVLPVYASRACYWGRCAFCDHGYGYDKEYRVRSPDKVVEDLWYLMDRYNTKYFSFADEAIPPKYFERLSNCIIESGINVRWLAHARAEKGFTEHLCRKMYRSGCRMLLFGIESGSQKILDLMDKGSHVNKTRKILKACRDAGIWNHVFLFFGFPGEREEDAEKTLQFVGENKSVINSVGCTTFLLGKYSRVCRERRFNVTICENEEEDMAIWYDYTVGEGLTREDVSRMRENLQKKLHDLYPNQSVLELICREHLLQLLDCSDFTGKSGEKPRIDRNFVPYISRGIGFKKVHHDFISFIEGKKDIIDPHAAYLVYNLQYDSLMEISETAFEILQLCTGKNSAEEISRRLSRKYDTDFETVLRDVVVFLSEMISKNIIV